MSLSQPKTALVLEGGAIRSAYLAGVLLALWEGGIRHFDLVVGTSAGACCGANFIAGTPEKSTEILENYLTSKKFVNFLRTPTFKNVVDIDFLIDEVCVKLVPLDLPKIKSSPTKFYISATDFETGDLVYFNNHDHDLLEALRASCAMPYFYRNKALYEGRRYMDGGMTASVPIEKALEEGASRIIVVGTRPKGYRKKPAPLPPWFHRIFYPKSPALGHLFKKRASLYNKSMDLIENPPQGITITYIAPHTDLPVSRTTKDRVKVKQAVHMGYEDGRLIDKKVIL